MDREAFGACTAAMTIELPASVEEQLRDLAARQGREIRALVEEAIRQYLEWSTITDVDASDVAETQSALPHEQLQTAPRRQPTQTSMRLDHLEWSAGSYA